MRKGVSEYLTRRVDPRRLAALLERHPATAAPERPEDIPLLVDAFIREFNEKYDRSVKSLDDEALRLLMQHGWPGNVRDLRNMIERVVVQSGGERITAANLPFCLPAAAPAERPNAVVLPIE